MAWKVLSSYLSFPTAQVQDCINIMPCKQFELSLYSVCPLEGAWCPCLGHCLHRICVLYINKSEPTSPKLHFPKSCLLTDISILRQFASLPAPTKCRWSATAALTYLAFREGPHFHGWTLSALCVCVYKATQSYTPISSYVTQEQHDLALDTL